MDAHPFVYPEIKFDGNYSEKVKKLYMRIIYRTIRHYYLMFTRAGDYYPFLTPIDVTVRMYIPTKTDLSGLADHKSVQIELETKPSFWSIAGIAVTIGHEFAHTYAARVLSQPNYTWGPVGRSAVNYIHYADGLARFYKNTEYIKRKWIPVPPYYVLGITVIPIAWFDVVSLIQKKAQIEPEIEILKNEPRWLLT